MLEHTKVLRLLAVQLDEVDPTVSPMIVQHNAWRYRILYTFKASGRKLFSRPYTFKELRKWLQERIKECKKRRS